MVDDATKDLQSQYDLIFEVISKKLEEQISLLSSIDSTASIYLAVIGVIIGGVFLLLTADKLGFREYKYFVCIELTSFAISGFFVFKAFILRDYEVWNSPPKPKTLLDGFSRGLYKSVYFLKEDIIKNMVIAHESNAILVGKKYKYFIIAQWFLYIGVIFLLLHIGALSFGINKAIIRLK